MRQPTTTDLEFSVAAHPARAGWHVLKVVYPDREETRTRVRGAVEQLLDAPTQSRPIAEPGTGADRRDAS